MCPIPHCIYKNTSKLSPGHSLELNIETKKITLHQYWNVYDAYNKPKVNIGFEEAMTETEKLLSSACNYRMVSDVPVGIFLSGGYDSSTVAALLQKDSSTRIKTFTIGFLNQASTRLLMQKKWPNIWAPIILNITAPKKMHSTSSLPSLIISMNPLPTAVPYLPRS
ncbi:asparagine synthetase [glutamine-hydrolyzing] 2 [Filimonas sp.]|nr:asparagine synthetase [glutamine-hydrolyzing] 2 [Filimonas sp.]